MVEVYDETNETVAIATILTMVKKQAWYTLTPIRMKASKEEAVRTRRANAPTTRSVRVERGRWGERDLGKTINP